MIVSLNNNNIQEEQKENNGNPSVYMMADNGEPTVRLLSLYGEINPERCEQIVNGLLFLEKFGWDSMPDPENEENQLITHEPIEMLISSEGGSALDMFAVYDIMRQVRSTTDIITLGVGKIMSAAILLLAAGTKGQRKVGKYCRLMLHPISGGTYGNMEDIEIDTKELNNVKEQYINALCEETGMTRRKVLSLVKRGDTYFNAEQAVEWGIADLIV